MLVISYVHELFIKFYNEPRYLLQLRIGTIFVMILL